MPENTEKSAKLQQIDKPNTGNMLAKISDCKAKNAAYETLTNALKGVDVTQQKKYRTIITPVREIVLQFTKTGAMNSERTSPLASESKSRNLRHVSSQRSLEKTKHEPVRLSTRKGKEDSLNKIRDIQQLKLGHVLTKDSESKLTSSTDTATDQESFFKFSERKASIPVSGTVKRKGYFSGLQFSKSRKCSPDSVTRGTMKGATSTGLSRKVSPNRSLDVESRIVSKRGLASSQIVNTYYRHTKMLNHVIDYAQKQKESADDRKKAKVDKTWIIC